MSNRIGIWRGNSLATRDELNRGLVAYFDFENNDLDSSGNGLHLDRQHLSFYNVLHNYGPGHISAKAIYEWLDLNTRSLNAYIPGNLAAAICTISGWWKPSISEESAGAFFLLSDSSLQSFGVQFPAWDIGVLPQNRVPFTLWGTDYLGVIKYPISADWNFFTLVKNGTLLDVYVNAVNVLTTTVVYDYPNLTNLKFYLSPQADYQSAWDGISLHNRALSQREVRALYNNGHGLNLGK